MPQAEQVTKVAGLLRKVKICMLTTQDGSGRLHGRPMAVQQVEFDGDLWFFTARDSSKARQVRHNPAVNVSFSSIADAVNGGLFVSITGYATVVDDPAKAKELWNDTYQAWFPGGLQDPELVLLKISVDTAEYWDGPNSLVTAFQILKSALTGQTPSFGEHAEVVL